jgi:hypothetical protein
MPSSSAWSPSPPSSFSDHQYSTPNPSLPSCFQPSKSPSLGGERYLGSHSAYPPYVQNVGSVNNVCSTPGEGSSSWSSSEAERNRDSLGIGSPERERGNESIWTDRCLNQLDNVHGTMVVRHAPLGVHPTGYDNPYAGTEAGVGITVGGREHIIVGSTAGDNGARVPSQTAGSRRSSSQSEQDMGDGLIICQLGCRTKCGFKNQQSFEAHLRSVHCDKLFPCSKDDCAKAFRNRTDLKRHWKATHEKAKPFRCDKPNCRARANKFSRKDKLKDHNRKHHSNFKCWSCSQDPKFDVWFEEGSELWDHTHEEHYDRHLQGEQYTSHSPLPLDYQDCGYPS